MYTKKVVKVFRLLKKEFPNADIMKMVNLAVNIVQAIEDDDN
jgi:hypothetical protein